MQHQHELRLQDLLGQRRDRFMNYGKQKSIKEQIKESSESFNSENMDYELNYS